MSVSALPFHRRCALLVWRFRFVGVVGVGCVVLLVVSQTLSPATTVVEVPVATRPLAAGEVVMAQDVSFVSVEVLGSPAVSFAGDEVVGAHVRVGVGLGEVLSGAVLTQSPAPPDGFATVSVSVANPSVLSVVAVGDHVAVVPRDSDAAQALTSHAVLLSVSTPGEGSGGALSGVVGSADTSAPVTVLLAVPHEQATEVALAAQWAEMAIVVLPAQGNQPIM